MKRVNDTTNGPSSSSSSSSTVINTTTNSNHIDGINNNTINNNGTSGLTLLRLRAWMQEPLDRMCLLARLVDAAGPLHGGTHPYNTPLQHTLSTHHPCSTSFNTLCNTPSQCILSVHLPALPSFQQVFQYALSMHPFSVSSFQTSIQTILSSTLITYLLHRSIGITIACSWQTWRSSHPSGGPSYHG